MSFNDRCGEAAEILRHGGTLPDAAVREALIELCEDGRDGGHFPSRDLVHAILEHPENAALRAQTSDGEWVGESRKRWISDREYVIHDGPDDA